MKVELEELLQKLGVSHVLSPYETMPWMHYDSEKYLTCSAEVRMNHDGSEIEAEIQLLKDEDAPDEDEEDTSSSEEEESEGDTEKPPKLGIIKPGGREQVMWMRANAAVANQWGPKEMRILKRDFVNKFHDWEGKGCDFFRACVESLQMSEIPEFNDLVDEHMKDDSFYGGGRRGRIGRKSPNIKPGQLLGMKK